MIADVRPARRGLALLVLAAGCGLPASLAHRVARHTYTGRCDAVLPAAREALLDRGYALRGGRDDVVETEWRRREPSAKGSAIPTRDRCVARLLAAGAVSCALRVTRYSDGVWPSAERDLDVEWDVLRRVGPEAARRAEAGDPVLARVAEARDQWRRKEAP